MRYPIGKQGVAWGAEELSLWQSQVEIKRPYQDLVVDRIYALSELFRIGRYGALSCDPLRYPLFSIEMLEPNSELPWVLISGGVHGYETSGVLGALAFLEESANEYIKHFNFLVLPCVSPWGFETINRWNSEALDPNRSFKEGGLCEEARFAMELLNKPLYARRPKSFVLHLDLHETTDTDESEFRPALAAKLGKDHVPTEIPDGFYLVGDRANPQSEFQSAIINAVEKVTHIAPNDAEGRLLGDRAAQRGVVNYSVKRLGLCAGVTDATYTTTTEVYPDSDNATPAQCIEAQVTAVKAALDYIISEGA